MDRDGESSEIWEGWVREYREGRGSECSEGGESEPEATE